MVKQLLTKFALLAVMLVGVGTTALAADRETLASFTVQSHDNWGLHANPNSSNVSYYLLTTSDVYIESPSISFSNYSDIQITIKARKYGGPSGTQGVISVRQSNSELCSVTPNSTSLANYGPSDISPTDGTITISCPNASNGKGCGVSEITITGIAKSSTNTFSVTYNANGATSGSVPTDATEYDATNNTVTVLGNTGSLAKTGYTFNGWNTKADGTGDGFAAGNTFTISANTTLYAQWTANTYSVTLPAADAYGTYTMDATSPVAYGTTVELTYTPASGYDNYAATWSVNDAEITGNTFTMPDEAVTVTVSVAKKTTKDMIIDFEKAVTAYVDWTFSNIETQGTNSSVTAHEGSYFGTNTKSGTAVATGSIQTKEKVNPVSLTCYVSKQTNNTTSSTWFIQVSSDGDNWEDVKSTSATDMNKGDWKEFSADLSTYSNMYVRIYYNGSNAIRIIDELTLVVQDSGEPSIDADAEVNLTAEDTEGEIAYTINNPVDGTSLTASTEASWITIGTITSSKVPFTTTVNTGEARTATITLTYGSLTKDVIVNQAKHVATSTYKLATAIVPGRHYIITNGSDKAMGKQNENNRAAVDITIENESATIASTAGVQEILIEFEDASGFYTIYDENAESVENCEGYLYATGSGKNYLRTKGSVEDDARWIITIANEGKATIESQRSETEVARYLRYNNINGLFSCYSSVTTMEDVYLYEKVGDTGTQDFTVSINSVCTDGTKSYGTFSAPFAFTVPSDVTVSEIAIENGALKVNDYAAGAIVPANTGVMISSATAGNKTFTSAEGGTKLGSDNRLRPVIWGISDSDMNDADANCKFYRLTMHNDTKIGFWWGADNGAAFDYDTPNRAYLAVPENVTARQSFWFDNEATGISSAKVSESTEQVYDLQGRSVVQPTKGLYIMNGKKVIIK